VAPSMPTFKQRRTQLAPYGDCGEYPAKLSLPRLQDTETRKAAMRPA
jgi:hypothetical protein